MKPTSSICRHAVTLLAVFALLACGNGYDDGESNGSQCTTNVDCPSGMGCNLATGKCFSTGNNSGGDPGNNSGGDPGPGDVPGDGNCTGSENAANTPQDCPAVAGDGYCTHSENPTTTPQDCGGVPGDGACTHTENASNTPQDCPAAAGDSYCTHSENASTTPQDCPAVDGDGFCTHSEEFTTVPSDCPPPNVVFPGGTLSDLRAYSANLIFGDLTLAGDLRLSPSTVTATLNVVNFTTAGGRIRFTQSACDWSAAPSIAILASNDVTINDPIELAGKPGVRSLDTATCNECNGASGGDVSISAATIAINADIGVKGGRGSVYVLTTSPMMQIGCDGGHGGDTSLVATSSIVLGPHNYQFVGGDKGTAPDGNGAEGLDGDLEWLAPSVTIAEDEPNATLFSAGSLALDPLTLTGSCSGTDDAATEGGSSALYVVFSDSTPRDFVEDMFAFRVRSTSSVTFNLSTVNAGTDLDLYLFDANLSTVAESNAPGGNESISTTLSAGRYYVVVSWCCGGPASNYSLSLSR